VSDTTILSDKQIINFSFICLSHLSHRSSEAMRKPPFFFVYHICLIAPHFASFFFFEVCDTTILSDKQIINFSFICLSHLSHRSGGAMRKPPLFFLFFYHICLIAPHFASFSSDKSCDVTYMLYLFVSQFVYLRCNLCVRLLN
jgi:hypothetical protein